jgi:hypothetical protein
VKTDEKRPWGERTPTQRLLTYSFFALASLVLAIVWFAGLFDPSGIGVAGYGVFPLGALYFGYKASRAFQERART